MVDEYDISLRDVCQIYRSPHPYNDAFEEELILRKYDSSTHPTAGFKFKILDERLIVEGITAGSPGAKIRCWRSRLKGAWLRQVGPTIINSLADAQLAFAELCFNQSKSCTLTFSHSEIKHGLTHDGIPQVNLDQLNPRLMFDNFPMPETLTSSKLRIIKDGDVFNYVTVAMKLTHGKLLKTEDWDVWNSSEHTQLDQYDTQGMFGAPVPNTNNGAVFNLVWTYVIKELDKRKKARFTCG